MYPIFCSCLFLHLSSCMLTLVIDSFLSVWGISIFDAFSSKPLLPRFHAQFIRIDSSLTPRVGGGVHSLCSAEQGVVFVVLSLKQGIQFHYWASCTGCLFGLKAFQRVWRLAMRGLYLQYQYFFPLNFYFHDFSVKNYLILYAKQKKSGSESSASFLKQSRGLKASAAQFYPDLPWVPLAPTIPPL